MKRYWTEYTGKPRAATPDAIYASLNQHGDLVLNRKAYEELGAPERVRLFYDSRTEAIGLMPADPEADNGHKVRRFSTGSTHLVHCSRFLRLSGIKIEKTVSFPTAKMENGLLVLELKYRAPATIPNRWPRR